MMKLALLNKKTLVVIFCIFLAIIFFIAYLSKDSLLTYFYRVVDPNKAADLETKILVDKIGKLIILPTGVPSVATVKDKEKLANQLFFERTQNGDKLLIYSDAKKAYLYRPAVNRLVEVAPLNLQNPLNRVGSADTTKTEVTPTPEKTTIAIYNGANITGLTNKFETLLQKNISTNESVNIKQNASAFNYEKSLIIDVSGNQSLLVANLAKKLNLQIGTLPANEKKPNSSILIILGKDQQ